MQWSGWKRPLVRQDPGAAPPSFRPRGPPQPRPRAAPKTWAWQPPSSGENNNHACSKEAFFWIRFGRKNCIVIPTQNDRFVRNRDNHTATHSHIIDNHDNISSGLVCVDLRRAEKRRGIVQGTSLCKIRRTKSCEASGLKIKMYTNTRTWIQTRGRQIATAQGMGELSVNTNASDQIDRRRAP